MSEILFLSHRIPFPPDKGDKIRSFHLLKDLASRHTVHLGTFIDDPRDWQYVEDVKKICAEVCILPLDPKMAKLRSVLGFLTGEALTMRYYRSPKLQQWVNALAARRSLAGIFMFSSSMGQFAESVALRPGAVKIMDFCDVDSDKWHQYAASHGWPMSAVYAREARKLADVERRYLGLFDATLVISPAEQAVLSTASDQAAHTVRVVPNGVDSDYFDPGLSYPNPFSRDAMPVVFVGAMDYHANVDAVKWFAQSVLPDIRRRCPSAVFVIVGSNPTAEVLTLAKEAGVLVTGRVPDVRPYLVHAAAVVAPLRIARGVQNKVLEALSMGRRVIATPNALQGIGAPEPLAMAVAATESQMVDTVLAAFEGQRLSADARAFVVDRFSWSANLARVRDLI